MAKKFKDYYDANTARLIADKILDERPDFNSAGFVKFISNTIVDREFLERQDVFVDALVKYLGDDHCENIRLFQNILGPELQTDTGMFTHGYWLWPIGRYIERYGVECHKTAIRCIYELTKRFTGEFAIRPILAKYPKTTISIILKWSMDTNVHVRRLASESMRIHLPWAKKSTVCLDYFDQYSQILTNLKNDPSKFVQKSVGNNLNDLYKQYPEHADKIIAGWQTDTPISPATLWIIKHGTRSSRK